MKVEKLYLSSNNLRMYLLLSIKLNSNTVLTLKQSLTGTNKR